MCNVPSGAEAYAKLYESVSSDGGSSLSGMHEVLAKDNRPDSITGVRRGLQPFLLSYNLPSISDKAQGGGSDKKGITVLRLGNVVPDFKAETTMGPMHWHEWINDSWAILFSHPADFTPVCTTEIGRLALKYKELSGKGVKIATLSADPVDSHSKWLNDVVAHCENGVTIDFPIIADPSREIAVKYGMLDPSLKDKEGLPLTIRAVFIVGPDKKLKLSLNYPASVGRNMDEIVRCVDALQLSAKYSVATPANWPLNHESIDKKGWAFLLPTVTPEDAAKHFPNHHSCKVPSGVDYLRLTDVKDLK